MHTYYCAVKSLGYVGFIWFVLTLFPAVSNAEQVKPDLSNTQIFSRATFSETENTYTYQYRIVNPSTNNQVIAAFRIDITKIGRQSTSMSDPLPQVPSFKLNTLKYLSQKGIRILPVELTSFPPGWIGLNISATGNASFLAAGETSPLALGEQLDGFTLTSNFVPGIRKVHALPGGVKDWFTFLQSNGASTADEATEEERRLSKEIEESFNCYDYALGPVGITSGAYEHWDHFRDVLNRSIELGWIHDATLASIMVGQLASAREALDAGDGSLAKLRLQTLVDQVTSSTESQRKSEAFDLINLNSLSLIKWTPDTPIPYETKLILTPSVSKLPIGIQHTITARVVNVAHNNDPVPGVRLQFRVTEGPNRGLKKTTSTDTNGEAVFSYIGKDTGTDKIEVKEPIVES
jgi:hypothetical protein